MHYKIKYMTRKTITLTGVGNVLTKEAEEKLFNKSNSPPTCDNGRTREFYEDLGLSVEDIPQSLKDKELAYDEEEDLEVEEVFSDVIVFIDEIALIVQDDPLDEDDKVYTQIFLKNNLKTSVAESAIEIIDLIDFINRNWFERVRDNIRYFFSRKKQF